MISSSSFWSARSGSRSRNCSARPTLNTLGGGADACDPPELDDDDDDPQAVAASTTMPRRGTVQRVTRRFTGGASCFDVDPHRLELGVPLLSGAIQRT